jgi:hypothetical protein
MDRNAFKHLAAWNQGMEESLEVLRKFAEYPELNEEEFTIKEAYFQEQLASVNLTILHLLEKAEQKILFSSFKERRAYEKKVRDPDDCYFDVLRREEERRNLGLPPLIGILRGMRRATSEEVLSDILADRPGQEDQVDHTGEESDPNAAQRADPSEKQDATE